MVKVFPVEAVILMLQNPQLSPRFLAAVRKDNPRGMQWVALSNTLAKRRAPGFAATLLYEVEPARSVLLSDDGQDWKTGGVVGSVPGGTVQNMLPSDFPPVIRYRLTSKPAPDDELFSKGPTPLYLRRVTIAPGTIPPWPGELYCAWSVRIDCLATLTGLSAQEVASAVEGFGRIRWSTAANLDAEVSRQVRKQVKSINHLAKLLIQRGTLKPSEISAPLRIEVQISDQRKNQPPVRSRETVTFTIHP